MTTRQATAAPGRARSARPRRGRCAAGAGASRGATPASRSAPELLDRLVDRPDDPRLAAARRAELVGVRRRAAPRRARAAPRGRGRPGTPVISENGIGSRPAVRARRVDRAPSARAPASSVANGVLYSSAQRAASAALRGPRGAAHDQRRVRRLHRPRLRVERRRAGSARPRTRTAPAVHDPCTISSCSASRSIRSRDGREREAVARGARPRASRRRGRAPRARRTRGRRWRRPWPAPTGGGTSRGRPACRAAASR